MYYSGSFYRWGYHGFFDKQAIIKYLGPKANEFVAYSVTSISGSILAVCSCTFVPLFRGISKKTSGLGPAISLSSILVINSVLGVKKTFTYVFLVVVISTFAGFGLIRAL